MFVLLDFPTFYLYGMFYLYLNMPVKQIKVVMKKENKCWNKWTGLTSDSVLCPFCILSIKYFAAVLLFSKLVADCFQYCTFYCHVCILNYSLTFNYPVIQMCIFFSYWRQNEDRETDKLAAISSCSNGLAEHVEGSWAYESMCMGHRC